MALPDLSLRRPVATTMLFVAAAVLGVVSFLRLPVDLLPDVAFPTRTVWTEYADAGPAEVERFVTEPLEERLSRIPGVRQVTSRSREGQSLVRLRFQWGTDMEFATLHVREALENLRASLPRSAGRPTILRTDPTSEPVMTLAVTGGELLELRNLSEAVFRRRLEQLEGVALAAVAGGPEREIQVRVDPERLAAYGIAIEDVRRALDAANYSAPGGQIRRGRFYYSLRTLGEFGNLSDLRSVTVARTDGGARGDGPRETVRLADVADVREGRAERRSLARYNGSPAIGLRIYKEAGANTVRVGERVEATLDVLRREFPGVTLEVAQNQATFVRNAISNVAQALLFGGLLAFLVLFLFLRDARYPVAIGLSIPISVLSAFGLLYLFDVSLNVMSLGGLALGVGMLVDNSIVVLENVFRHREEGRDAATGAAVGAREVAAAITASTLTTIAVFGPVLYVEGVAGALFRDLSLAVAFSLFASLVVALTLLPVLAARLAGARLGRAGASDREGAHGETYGLRYVVEAVRLTAGDVAGVARRVAGRTIRPALDSFQQAFRGLATRYERALEWSLEHRATVLVVSLVTLGGAVLVGGLLPRSLMPQVDEGQFRVEVELPVGTPLATTAGEVESLERVLLDMSGVDGVFSRIGRARGTELAGEEFTGLNSAGVEVRLAHDAPPAQGVARRFRARLRETGIDPRFVSVSTGRATSLGRALALTDADLEVRIQGQHLETLLSLADSVAGRLRDEPRLSDVRVDVQRTQPELEIEVLRDEVARHGLTVREVADAIEAYLRGVRTERPYTEFTEKVAIRVRLPGDGRRDLADVLSLTVRDVPVDQLVSVRRGYGPVEIRRRGQARTVRVLASVQGAGLGEAVERTRSRLAGLEPPDPVSVRVGGANERMRESFRSLLFAFGLALFLVYLILAAQFESLLQPVVILSAVPLAAVGAVLALAVTGGGLNVMSGIGTIVLIGIVVNDAIIKVDFVNQRRAEGLSSRDAILEAGRLRLRPIVMTTVTTVFGLLPLALGWGAGADLRAPLAVAVIGGLISATFLTLLVVPVIYSLVVRGEEAEAPVPRDVGRKRRTVTSER